MHTETRKSQLYTMTYTKNVEPLQQNTCIKTWIQLIQWGWVKL